MRSNYYLLRHASNDLIKRLKIELVLSILLARVCSAHYVLESTAYLPYLVNKSRRAVVEGPFLTQKMLQVDIGLHFTKERV